VQKLSPPARRFHRRAPCTGRNFKGGGHRGVLIVAWEKEISQAVAILGGELVDVTLQEEEMRGVEGQGNNFSSQRWDISGVIGFCR